MALKRTRRLVIAATTLATLVAILAYLRDPPWLSGASSGFYGWQTGDDGAKFRWMAGHASFFVPADAAYVEIPLRAEFDSPHGWNVAVSVAIDDRPAARIALTDESWRKLRVLLPPRSSRRLRRIDIRVNRVNRDDRGVQVGDFNAVPRHAVNGSR